MTKFKTSGRIPKTAKAAPPEVVFCRLKALNPNPKTELFYKTPFQLLVSVVLSAQTTDKMVNSCMQPLYERTFTPETVIKWGEQGFLAKIKRIGLANTKARNVVALSKLLLENFQGNIPDSREALQSLPGVGRKTANVVLAELYQQPTLAVDTHIFRVGRRLGWHNEKNPEKAELQLLKVIPKKFLPKAHHWLILHGRYTCKARQPLCGDCVLQDICPAFRLKIF